MAPHPGTIQRAGAGTAWSKTKDYGVPSADPTIIFGKHQPRASAAYQLGHADPALPAGGYTAYKSVLFLADCLHTAEEVINNDEFEQGEDHSKVKATGTLFGQGDDENKAAALAVEEGHRGVWDDGAVPGVGEAYCIVDLGWPHKVKRSPYHAAAVVATDGISRITVEVFANGDAEERDTQGTYRIYSSDPAAGTTFHGYWTKTYPYFPADTSTTIVIVPA